MKSIFSANLPGWRRSPSRLLHFFPARTFSGVNAVAGQAPFTAHRGVSPAVALGVTAVAGAQRSVAPCRQRMAVLGFPSRIASHRRSGLGATFLESLSSAVEPMTNGRMGKRGNGGMTF